MLWSHFSHGGKNYKLILTYARSKDPMAGEEWEVYPEGSPNGRIVFCHPVVRLKTASGQHPFVARTAEHVRNRWVVEVTPKFRTDWMWKRGPLELVSVADETLRIMLSDRSSDQLFTLVVPVWYTESWLNRRNSASQRFGGDCEVAGKRYFVFFSDDANQ